MAPNKPAYNIWDRQWQLTYKYEELTKSRFPKLRNLFVLRFCLIQIKRPDDSVSLVILNVVVSTVRSWTLLSVGSRLALPCSFSNHS